MTVTCAFSINGTDISSVVTASKILKSPGPVTEVDLTFTLADGWASVQSFMQPGSIVKLKVTAAKYSFTDQFLISSPSIATASGVSTPALTVTLSCNHDVMWQATGTDGVIAFSGGVATFTSASMIYTGISVNQYVTLSGATHPGNNGTFIVTAVGSGLTITNPNAVNGDTSITWVTPV